MKKIISVFLLFGCGICAGQNLVPNGDFEQFWHCPNGGSQIDSAKFWFRPTYGTSDYYNVCGTGVANVPNVYCGFQQPHGGAAFAGGFFYIGMFGPDNYREYIETHIEQPLTASQCYYFEMYINLGNICSYSTFNQSVYFSDTIITGLPNILPLPYLPQISNTFGNLPDTSGWTLVSGNYTAHGGESYLIIGNFKDDLSIDTIGVNTGSFPVSYIHIDDVSLIPCTSIGIANITTPEINIFPNPIASQLTITASNNVPSEIILYDISSRKILQQTFTSTTTINTEALAKGMYMYEVKNKNGVVKNGKVIKE